MPRICMILSGNSNESHIPYEPASFTTVRDADFVLYT